MAGGTEEGIREFLSRPESYPERPSRITHHETHISEVFVGDAAAYKIKKRVNFGFLDFSTLERRRFFCTEEVVLNRRLAGDTYIGVVPIYERDGRYSFRPSRGAAVVEYAVKMKRIPEERLLSSLIAEGGLLAGEAAEVGTMLARFHAAAPVQRTGPYGGIETVRTNTEENFEQIAPYRGVTLDPGLHGRLVDFTHAFLSDHEDLFRERKASGLVREVHGDLRAEHVCLVRPPIVVDCIEFNRRFRISDILEDIAFLLMDLEHAGRFDLSRALSAAYFSGFREAESAPLLLFYKVYRAVVRGKVEGFAAGPPDASITAGKEAGRRAVEHYELARYYLTQGQSPFNPVVVMGPAGSGKSEIGRALIPGAEVLRSDEVRKRMAGMAATDHAYVDYGTGLYDAEATGRTYGALTASAVSSALEGKRVVVDATFLSSELRKRFYAACETARLNPFFIFLFADEPVLAERMRRRIEDGRDASDAHLAVLERQLASMEAPSELPPFRVMRLDTGRAGAEETRRALRLFLIP